MNQNFELVFISSFHDKPLAGLCRVNGILMKFYVVNDEKIFIPLKFKEKINWLIKKWFFEICVGRHWSYRRGSNYPITNFHWRQPIWLHKKLFNLYFNLP